MSTSIFPRRTNSVPNARSLRLARERRCCSRDLVIQPPAGSRRSPQVEGWIGWARSIPLRLLISSSRKPPKSTATLAGSLDSGWRTTTEENCSFGTPAARHLAKGAQGFAVCTRCGFAMSEDKPPSAKGGPAPLPREFRAHASVFASDSRSWCWPKDLQTEPGNFVTKCWRRRKRRMFWCWIGPVAGQRSRTSIRWASPGVGRYSDVGVETAAYLAVVMKDSAEDKTSILVYDTIPGGAGHCLELMELGRKWLEEARNILRGSAEHDCGKACMDCILDFAGQVKALKLDRRRALEILDVGLR